MDWPISSLVASADGGDRSPADALFPALDSERHRLAKRPLARRGGVVTLGAAILLHQACLDISKREGAFFPDRGRFTTYAAGMMRGLIIDHARNRRATS